MKKYLPLIVVVGSALLLLLVLTYYEPPRRDALDETIWQVTDMSEVTLIEETTLTLRFHKGKVNGSSGCNRFNGAYSVKGSQISINVIDKTTENCMRPGIMEQEREFISYLGEITSYPRVCPNEPILLFLSIC